MNIVGNTNTLFSMHGFLDPGKLINAIQTMTDIETLDIDEINKKSEAGGIYVKQSGTIMETFDKADENLAKYKLVPTGLKFRYTEYPLFASFIKLKGQWEGCFVGTGTMLFDMYKKHYNGDFDETYMSLFGGENRTRDICGFGLSEVIDNDTSKKISEDVVYSTEDNEDNNLLSNELALALDKLKSKAANDDSSSSSNRSKHKTKAQRKAERLQKHLERIKKQEEKQAENQRIADEQKRIAEEESKKEHGILWSDVSSIEETHCDFEDEQTLLLNKKIEDYINNDDVDTKVEEADSDNNESLSEDSSDNLDKDNEKPEKTVETVEAESKNEDKSEATETEPLTETELDILNDLEHDNYVMTESQRYRIQIKNDIINDIYERLLIKERWKHSTKNRLGFYLKAISFFVWREQQISTSNSLRGNGYTYSNDRKICVINTGLIDNYGNYIYLIDHSPSVPDFYAKVVSVLYNKTTLLKLNFDIDNVKFLPEPIEIVKDKSKLVFNANYSDFDLDDTAHIYHIATERIGRFPDRYASETPLAICDKIRSAIRQAVMIQKTDFRYIIPKYDFKRQAIQFMIPFYLEQSYDEAPELTIVVGEQDGIWSIFTVLYSDDAYDDARLLSRASDTWLDMRKHGGN